MALPLALSTHASERALAPLLDDQGGRLDVIINDQFGAEQTVDLQNWIKSIADSLAGVYGHWPRKHWQISIESASGSLDDPIPWAQVNRGAVDEVEFFVVDKVDASTLIQEWTGYHELAHLLIPYRGWGDAWFSEGLASYYQNLLQARSGIISEQQMWQKLYDGFERGRSESQFDGQTLDSVSASLRYQGGFMRVYWSGAWYFLAADLALRSESAGQVSLDSALNKLNACCGELSMSVPAMVEALDGINHVDVFQQLYDDVAQSTSQPAFDTLFASLGISVVGDKVVLEQHSEAAQLRRAISAAPPL